MLTKVLVDESPDLRNLFMHFDGKIVHKNKSMLQIDIFANCEHNNRICKTSKHLHERSNLKLKVRKM